MTAFKRVLTCLANTIVTCGIDMFDQLAKELRIASDAFKDNMFSPITEKEFQNFLKEATFEKLKGKKLGEIFIEKFGVHDRVLSIFSDDRDVIKHIRYCKYIK